MLRVRLLLAAAGVRRVETRCLHCSAGSVDRNGGGGADGKGLAALLLAEDATALVDGTAVPVE